MGDDKGASTGATISSVEDLRAWVANRWRRLGVEPGDFTCASIVDPYLKSQPERTGPGRSKHVDIWIALFDEFLGWYILLFEALDNHNRQVTEEANALTDYERSIIAILFKIIGDSFAFRLLIISGYDVAARTLLRSILEYFEVFVAIINDPQLAERFAETGDVDKANAFWHETFSKGKIDKKLAAAWQERLPFWQGFLNSLNSTLNLRNVQCSISDAAWFAELHQQDKRVLAACTHPSMASGWH